MKIKDAPIDEQSPDYLSLGVNTSLEPQEKLLDDESARSAAWVIGAINGFIEFGSDKVQLGNIPGISKLLAIGPKQAVINAFTNKTKAKLLKDIALRSLKGAFTEGAEEFFQEAVSILVSDYATNKTGDAYSRARLALSRLGEPESIARMRRSFQDAFLGGLVFNTATGASNYAYSIYKLKKDIQQQKIDSKLFTELGEAGQNSELLKRSDSRFKGFVETALKDGPAQNVYIPIDEWNTYFQKQELDPSVVAEQTNVKNYDEANSTGGDVVISIADYASKIANSPHHEAFQENFKLTPEGSTRKQIAEQQKVIQKAMEEQRTQTENVVEEVRQTITPEEQRQFDVIFEDLKTQIIGAGFDASTAEAYAVGPASVLTKTARDLNTNALDLYDRFQLNILDRQQSSDLRKALSEKELAAKEKAPMGLPELVDLARTGNTEGLSTQLTSLLAPFKDQLSQIGIDLNQVTNNEQVVNAIQEQLATAPDDSPLKRIISQLSEAQQVKEYVPDKTLFQKRVSDVGFYSPLENAVDEMDFVDMPAQDLAGRIKNLPGVKKDEIEFTGIMEWLSTIPGKVTKQEVIEFLQKNGVVLEQVVQGEEYKPKRGPVVTNQPENALPIVERFDWSDEGTVIDPNQSYIDDEIDRVFFEEGQFYEGAMDANTVLENRYRDLLETEVKEFLKRNPNNLRLSEGVSARNENGESFFDIIDSLSLDEVWSKSGGLDLNTDALSFVSSDEYRSEYFFEEKLKETIQEKALLKFKNLWSEEIVRDYYEFSAEYKYTERYTGYTLTGNEEFRNYFSDDFGEDFSGSFAEATIKFAKWLVDNGKAQTEKMYEEAQSKLLDRPDQNDIQGENKNQIEKLKEIEKPKAYPGYKSHIAPGNKTNYREFVLKLPNLIDKNYDHFDENNILLFVRTTDRIDDNGKKVLYVEEIQSDLMQKVREGTVTDVKVPYTTTDAWTGLAIKKLLIVAAKEGHDAVALGPGQIQYERWGTENIAWMTPKQTPQDFSDEIIRSISETLYNNKQMDNLSAPSYIFNRIYDNLPKKIHENIQSNGIKKLVSESMSRTKSSLYEDAASSGERGFSPFSVEEFVKRFSDVFFSNPDVNEIVSLSNKEKSKFVSDFFNQSNNDISEETDLNKIRKLEKEIESVKSKNFFIISNNPSLGRNETIETIDDLIRSVSDSGQIVSSFEEVRDIVFDAMPNKPRSAQRVSEKIWEQMQAGVSGLKQPRKEGLLYSYDFIIPKVAKEVISKLDKEAKITDSTVSGGGDRKLAVKEIPITPTIKQKALEGLTLFQDKNDTENGFITFSFDPNSKKRKFDVGLLKADLSTLLHELGHYYLELLADASEVEGANPKLKEDFQTILKWMGVKDRSKIERKHHEMFARAHEAYLREGRAPSSGLRAAFARYKAWLVNFVYKSAKALNVKLNDDVRDVFDRLYASEEQINKMKDEEQYVGLISSAQDAGITDDEFRIYVENLKTAIDRGKEKILSKLIRQKQREKEVAWKEQTKLVKKEVEDKYKSLRSVRALNSLLEGFVTDKTDRNNPEKVELKINEDDLDSRYEKLKKQIKGKKKGIYDKNGNATADEAAAYLGYENGYELLQDIINIPDEKAYVSENTDRIMKERNGDIMSDGTIVEEAVLAMHNEAREEVLATELRIIENKIKETRRLTAPQRAAQRSAAKSPPQSAFREAARRLVSEKAIMDLYPNTYLRAEQKASRLAMQAMGKGEYEEAKAQKEKELLNHFLFIESSKAVKESEKIRKYAQSFTEGTKRRRIGKAQKGYLEQIDAIIDKYELVKRPLKYIEDRETLAEWLLKRDRDSDLLPEVDRRIVESASKKNYKEATIDELISVRDALKSIEHSARAELTLLTSQEAVDFADAQAEMMMKLDQKPQKENSEIMTLNKSSQKAKSFFKSAGLEHRNFASLLGELDLFEDGGAFFKYVIAPMNAAGTKESSLRLEYSEKLNKILEGLLTTKNVGPYPLRKTEYFEKLKQDLSWENRMAIAFNWGNEGNRQRLVDGVKVFGWTQEGIQDVLDSLTKEEWDAVQAVWDLMDSLRPMIAEKERRVVGVEPKWVQPSKVVTKHGVYNGGYYPIVYDPKASPAALNQLDAQEAKTLLKGTQFAVKPRDGFKQERQDQVKDRPLMLTMAGTFSGLGDVIHDLAWHEWAIDANKIFKNRDIANAITRKYGDEFYREIKGHIEDIVVGQRRGPRGWMDVAMDQLRFGTTRMVLGLNPFNAVQNLTGATNGIVAVGPVHFARSLLKYVDFFNNGPVALYKRTIAKSELMRLRGLTKDRDISEIRQQIAGKSKWSQLVDENIFMLTIYTQRINDTVTWNAIYDKQLFLGKDEKTAIDLADQGVIELQGAGEIKDQSRIQKGDSFKKLFTMFYGYFGPIYQRLLKSYKQTDKARPETFLKFGMDYIALVVYPVWATIKLKELLLGEPEDDEDEEKKLLKEMLLYQINFFPLIREVSSPLAYTLGLEDRKSVYGGPAGARVVKELMNFWYDVADGEWDEATTKSATALLGVSLKLPTVQMYKTFYGTKAYLEGETDNVGSIIMGPPKR